MWRKRPWYAEGDDCVAGQTQKAWRTVGLSAIFVVSAAVTALLLSLAIQIHKHLGTLNPDTEWPLRG